MQPEYRGIAYTLKAQTAEYPFTAQGCYRGRPIQLGASQPQLRAHTPSQRVYRGVVYQA